MSDSDDVKTVKQCKTCPWRADCDPEHDIPNFDINLARKLTVTIRSGVETIFERERHVMACHYSKQGAETPCAGWLHHQIGDGNNIAVRIGVMTGRYPVPEIDGEQHATFEATLPKKRRKATKTRR